MKLRMLAFMMLALPLAAQEHIQKLIPLKYADPRTISEMLRVFDAQVISNTELHALAVKATPQTMQAVEEAITRLDTPAAAPKNIDLTIYLVVGSDGEGVSGATLPKELESVVAQLKNSFPFKNYRLLDLMTLRSRTGLRASTDSSGGYMQFGTITKPVTSSFSLNSSSIGSDGTTIRLDQVRLNSRLPLEVSSGQFNIQELTLNTDLDIKEGQKVVVGRMGINREQALFLVVTARIAQ